MPRICPPGMVTVVQPGVTPRSGHESMYIAAQDDRQVHVEHVAYFSKAARRSKTYTAVRIRCLPPNTIEMRGLG